MRVLFNDYAEFNSRYNPNKLLYFDSETTNLYSNIKLISLYQEHFGEYVFVFDIYRHLQSRLEKHFLLLDKVYKANLLIIHNASFDLACFVSDSERFGIDLSGKEYPFLAENFEDTLLLAKMSLFRILDSFTLDKCFEAVLGFNPYTEYAKNAGIQDIETFKKSMQKSFVSTKTRNKMIAEPTKEQIDYAALDVFYLPRLYHACKESLDNWCYKLDKLFIQYALKWQQNGLPISKRELEKEKVEAAKSIGTLNTRLFFELDAPNGFLVNSAIQAKKFLDEPDTSSKTLKSLLLQIPRLEKEGKKDELQKCYKAEVIYKLRKEYKKLNFLERYNFDRVKGFFAPLTASGRAMCSGAKLLDSSKDNTDNLMQIPRNLHNLIGFDEGEKLLVYADFAQLELRTACAAQGDEVLYNLFMSGKDLHKYAATKIYNCEESDITKIQRTMAKFSNFCLLYMGSSSMFRAVVTELGDREPPSESECNEIVRKWKTLYPGIKAWHNKLLNQFKLGNMVGSTLNGRPYKAKLYTDLAAIENQGLGAEIAKLVIHYLHRDKAVLGDIELKLLVFIHDSFILEAKNLEEAKVLAKYLGDTMIKAWKQGIKNSRLPNLEMPTDVEVVKNWADIESDKVLYKYSVK
ncbi:hypothetical protein FBF91_08025 [Campylobacter upsaliensis]|uniref:DNA polymerase n=1 Tax=Campylobacter upsaliensis TaxID=28080 RepID=UPI0012BF2661|nr:DNA polymerase [Campylobacter upsaliensis]EAK7296944.1 hypothetical protein [Campylobacter upsaliensis]MBJ6809619.1 hypothetical protein [Campylobacter upsaliensis]